MTAVVKWLGHGAFEIKTDEHTILLDPFLTDNPQATVTAESLTADTILITHGHFDHVNDAASIANRTGATIIAPVETASWFETTQDVKNTVGMNLGGGL
ncbi:MAG: MBL fold metallo-hydrolase, partial [Planctomycetaceae bacterium]|nr:MBL fold metallo-hydrolase [Planctomycetaceae bacterium]